MGAFSVQDHYSYGSASDQEDKGCVFIPTPVALLQCLWAGSEWCSHSHFIPLPQSGVSGSHDLHQQSSAILHASDWPLHLTTQLQGVARALPHAHTMRTGSEQVNTVSHPDRETMEDVEVNDFDTPLLDFHSVLEFVSETLPGAQGTTLEEHMPRVAGMPQLLTPSLKFNLQSRNISNLS